MKKLILLSFIALIAVAGNAGNVKREYLKDAIQEMKAGKNISITESHSVGCSIKRVG